MRLGSLFVLAAVTAAAVAATSNARAVGTRTFELDSLDKLSSGDVKGASIGSDGVDPGTRHGHGLGPRRSRHPGIEMSVQQQYVGGGCAGARSERNEDGDDDGLPRSRVHVYLAPE